VVELHGDALTYTCMACSAFSDDLPIPAPSYPPTCSLCGAILRPNVVLFGEGLPSKALNDARGCAEDADVVLVVGTSVVVEPAASLPFLALASGALVVEVNTNPTALTGIAQYTIQSPASSALPPLLERIKLDLGCA
jgi:NAD-dependent deacetylase